MWSDEPKSLRDAAERARRASALDNAHMRPLVEFADKVRQRYADPAHVPNFDSLDGGVEAECLFLLEAPGPGAVASTFVSRNNPDETAKNFFLFNLAAGLERRRTITWNIVPGYVGSGTRIRPVNMRDIRGALPGLGELMALLPRLRVVALIGKKAARAEAMVLAMRPTLHIVRMPHPSPMFVNRRPHHRDIVIDGLRAVRSLLDVESANSA